jgi:hypothetical protein
MQTLRFTHPFDYARSPITGWTRAHWEEIFAVLMKGIIDSASPGGARQRIPGQRSHHGLLADEMEGFSRTFIMAGPWLRQSDSGAFTLHGEEVDVAEFYRQGILAGTDPAHPEYWGEITDYAQHLVECAALAWSLYLSRAHVWDQYTEAQQRQVADYLLQCTKVKYHQNNWLLFNVITNTVLKKLGVPARFRLIPQALSNLREADLPAEVVAGLEGLLNRDYASEADFVSALEAAIGAQPAAQFREAIVKQAYWGYSQEQIDAHLSACDHMYMRAGWYRDGNINRIDYYNAWAFHYYYLLWVILDGDSKPQVAAAHKQRVREFARDFRYFFASDGGVPCFGRSMIYRFGYLSPVVLGYYLGCLDLEPGEVRTLCTSGVKFFFDHPILTDRNHLSMGFLRPCAEILEHYSCGGSPYWAVKTFNVFLIPPDDPFWQAAEQPLPIQQRSFSQPLKHAGLLLVGDRKSGHVQLVNHKSYHDKAEYNAKYTKFAYSSIFSYEARPIYSSFNCDNVLQFSEDGINFRQRWSMQPLYCEADFSASQYPLYQIDDAGMVYTYTLVKDDFLINFHQIETHKSLLFREGGYPLGFDDGAAVTRSVPGAEAAYKDGKLSFIRSLHGYTAQFKAAPFHDDINGTNVRYRQSVTPRLEYENGDRHKFYLAAMVYGKIGCDSLEQLLALVTDFRVTENTAAIGFYDGERAFMQIGDVRDVQVTLNGQTFEGEIVLARVSADGARSRVLDPSARLDGHPPMPPNR